MQSSNSTSHLHFHGQDRLNISSDEKHFKETSPLRDFKGIASSTTKLLRQNPHLSSTSTLYSRPGGGGKFDVHSASTSSLPDTSIDPSQQYVWAWGANEEGQLSLGVKQNSLLPHPIRLNKLAVIGGNNSSSQIKMISCSRQFTASVTLDGRCLMVGNNLVGRLGIQGLTLTNLTRFRPINIFNSSEMRVKQVACGQFHTLALLQSGYVYSWGGTLHGKLGRDYIKEPRLVQSIEHQFIEKVACGDWHSIALSKRGGVFSWGGGEGTHAHGQCGQGTYDQVKNPKQIRYLEGKEVVEISAGKAHTLVLTSSNQLWAFGNGQHGQCGFGDNGDTPIPKLVTISRSQIYVSNQALNNPQQDQQPQIVGLAAGGRHSLIFSDRGLVYTFGLGTYGQLGHRNNQNYTRPRLVRDLVRKNIVDGAVGWHHSVVLDIQGNIYTCGTNGNGQLGTGDKQTQNAFTHVSKLGGKNINKIFAGGNHTWAIVDPIEPVKMNYQPPTPPGTNIPHNILASSGKSPMHSPSPNKRMQGINTPSSSVKRAINPRAMNFDKSKSSDNLTLSARGAQKNNFPLPSSMIPEKLPQFLLHVIYTKDIGMCHRFIRYEIKERDFKKMDIQMTKFVNQLNAKEGGYVYHRINSDSDIFDEEHRLAVSGNQSRGDGKLSFTFLHIFEPMKALSPILPIRPDLLQDVKTDKQEIREKVDFTALTGDTPIGKIVCFKDSDIERNEYEQKLAKWIRQFQRIAGNLCCNKPKFFQLRPNAYYSEI